MAKTFEENFEVKIDFLVKNIRELNKTFLTIKGINFISWKN